ncbi:hypothetical protein SLEP1_g48204 [Rubroshorea leprosula]|uniref:Uncharacterized protein n=1 Tax=Rubroshorea leprosula TaxID=152421 RepID=A0AAV5LT11_9ROSI|nr:hypothetical protein SLEP1_g48204 [Rubroshorea leprosula]
MEKRSPPPWGLVAILILVGILAFKASVVKEVKAKPGLESQLAISLKKGALSALGTLPLLLFTFPVMGYMALIVKAKNSIFPRLFPHAFVRSY